MKLSSLLFLLSVSFLLLSPMYGQEAGRLGKTSASWPGIEFEITKIERVDQNRLLVVIRVQADEKAANPTLLGFPQTASSPGAVAGADIPDPLSLRGAVLVDDANQKKYSALAELPSKPFYGPNELLTTIRPGEWLQMSVLFPSPPIPAAGSDGKVPMQKVSVFLPHAKDPIRNVILPPLKRS